MKLITFTVEGNSRVGTITDDNKIIDLNYAYQAKLLNEGKYRYKQIAEAFIPAEMEAFLQGGRESIEIAKGIVDFALNNSIELNHTFIFNRDEVKVEAPLSKPGKIICVGHNYREHILEMGRELPTYPVVFAKFANTIVGPEDDIPYYPISEQLDYEAELAFVVGKQARNTEIFNDEHFNGFKEKQWKAALRWVRGSLLRMN